ncbi:hypothetical protein RFI_00832 [Reticulomyxa filosa]|uniref:Uncharacterized protein n=1 Tax=Reticulomyxa filosa TaxID=46433 RepID=X6PEX7_RETFI|nr:hypothetical protein RFI_00832 [Reticulomyxa filosa]|eukprot:ETO36232.1 hypothetical protein RFI_00832 [Reticulomyxa filosa]
MLSDCENPEKIEASRQIYESLPFKIFWGNGMLRKEITPLPLFLQKEAKINAIEKEDLSLHEALFPSTWQNVQRFNELRVYIAADVSLPYAFTNISAVVSDKKKQLVESKKSKNQLRLYTFFFIVQEEEKDSKTNQSLEEINTITLFDCLDLWTEKKKLPESDAWYCSKCQDFL